MFIINEILDLSISYQVVNLYLFQ